VAEFESPTLLSELYEKQLPVILSSSSASRSESTYPDLALAVRVPAPSPSRSERRGSTRSRPRNALVAAGTTGSRDEAPPAPGRTGPRRNRARVSSAALRPPGLAPVVVRGGGGGGVPRAAAELGTDATVPPGGGRRGPRLGLASHPSSLSLRPPQAGSFESAPSDFQHARFSVVTSWTLSIGSSRRETVTGVVRIVTSSPLPSVSRRREPPGRAIDLHSSNVSHFVQRSARAFREASFRPIR